MELPINQIMNGDALTHLKELPDQSINMVMTSPPYWALRDYGTTEKIWDGEEGCEHEWGKNIINKRFGNVGKNPQVGNQKEDAMKGTENNGNFCIKCQAWKGNLGLEPTFDLYIKHLCDIFDEVKRVLRDDGVVFVNIRDTYYGSGSGTQYDPSLENSKEVYVMPYNSAKIKQRKKDAPYKEKSLCMIPFRFAIEMVNRGWILRNTIIWYKPNAMPSSVKDRFTVDFEYLFLFSKQQRYYFEPQYEEYAPASDVRYRQALRANKSYNVKSPYRNNIPYVGKFKEMSIQEANSYNSPRARYKRGQGSVVSRGDDADGLVIGVTNPLGRNMRTVWKIPTQPNPEAHFATYPEALCEIPIRAGCPEGGIVLDMFFGAGTTAIVALKQNKKFIGIELNPEYIKIAKKRLKPYLEQSKIQFVKDERKEQ